MMKHHLLTEITEETVLQQQQRLGRAEEEELMSPQRELPHDLITQHILTRLSVKQILRFKSVSRQWYSTLSSYQFANSHFKFSSSSNPYSSHTHYVIIQRRNNFYLFTYHKGDEFRNNHTNNLRKLELDFNRVVGKDIYSISSEPVVDSDCCRVMDDLVGSCNGLVCLASPRGTNFILWNPITHQLKTFQSGSLNCPVIRRVSWGFNYVSSEDDYKVVRIIELPYTVETMVHIFSLKAGRWTKIDPKVFQDALSLVINDGRITGNGNLYSEEIDRGVLCNERVYWKIHNRQAKNEGWIVVGFDFVDETFETIHGSNLQQTTAFENKFLCVMRGCLSTFDYKILNDVSICMHRRYGKRVLEGDESGRARAIINLSRHLRLGSCKDLIDFSGTGQFFVLNGYWEKDIGFVDSNSEPMFYRRLLQFGEEIHIQFERYVPSLVSPLGAYGVGT